jgi:hypothetical protein
MSRVISLLVSSALFVVIVILAGCTQSTEPSKTKHSDDHGDPHAEHRGGDGGELMVTTKPATPEAGDPASLELMIHDASGKMVSAFEETHEKLAHLIIVRAGLDEFAHLHPNVTSDGRMKTEYTFPSGGDYRLFVDYKAAGKPQATAQAVVKVKGDAPNAPALTPNVPGTISAEGLQVDVSAQPSGSGTERTMRFTLKDEEGQPVTDLEPYLGAMGHLVVLSADGREYVHAHPRAASDSPGVVEFDVHFPAAGMYKAWGQFQRQSKVVTVPAVLEVQEG